MSKAAWTFLSNHGHVILCLAGDPQLTIRDLSIRVGITERAVQNILNDLVEAEYLQRQRVGRHNTYLLSPKKALRHPVESHRSLGDLVRLISPGNGAPESQSGS